MLSCWLRWPVCRHVDEWMKNDAWEFIRISISNEEEIIIITNDVFSRVDVVCNLIYLVLCLLCHYQDVFVQSSVSYPVDTQFSPFQAVILYNSSLANLPPGGLLIFQVVVVYRLLPRGTHGKITHWSCCWVNRRDGFCINNAHPQIRLLHSMLRDEEP